MVGVDNSVRIVEFLYIQTYISVLDCILILGVRIYTYVLIACDHEF